MRHSNRAPFVRPFGDDAWRERIARLLGIESTLRPQGRPRKAVEIVQALREIQPVLEK